MASYKNIQTFEKQRYGIVAQTCWIAHVKELNGLPLRRTRTSTSMRRGPSGRPGNRGFRFAGVAPRKRVLSRSGRGVINWIHDRV